MKPSCLDSLRRPRFWAEVGLLLAVLAGPVGAATLADFGYQNMRIHNQAATGVRPLLVVLVTFANRPAFAHPPSYYQSLVFSASSPSLYGYHREASHGRFAWSMGNSQPLTLNQPFERCGPYLFTNLVAHGFPDNANTAWTVDTLVVSNVVWQVMSNGFDFRSFDTNHNGVVREEELSLLIISNENEYLGATRSSGQVNPPSGTANAIVNMGGVAHINHQTEFGTLTHEMSHVLGATDLYDDAGCKGYTVSVMSCTLPWAVETNFVSYYLDAWHRLQLGWTEPRLYSLTAGGRADLPAAQLSDPASPVLLYDPARGTSEFFLLEYRSAMVNSSASRYDQNLHSNGLAIWFIQQDANHNLVNHPSTGRNWDKAFYTLAAPALNVGGWDQWGSGSSTPPLRWYDGSASPTHILVHPFTTGASSITVEWINETGLWVDFKYHGAPQDGAFATPFGTLNQGLNAVAWGGMLTFKNGHSTETGHLNRRLELRAYDGPVTLGQ